MYSVNVEDLSEKAYSAIKEMILEGELKPGEKLYQEKIATDLGISRTPLNSALNRLDKEMLVEALPRRGFNVKKLSLKELVDLYDIRLRLEPLAAREATECKSVELFKSCRNLLNKYKTNSTPKQKENFKQIDYNFHNLITEMCGNVFLQKMISSYNIISLGNLQLFLNDHEYPKKTADSIADHIKILKAILAKDADAAEREMFNHINITHDIIKKRLIELE